MGVVVGYSEVVEVGDVVLGLGCAGSGGGGCVSVGWAEGFED